MPRSDDRSGGGSFAPDLTELWGAFGLTPPAGTGAQSAGGASGSTGSSEYSGVRVYTGRKKYMTPSPEWNPTPGRGDVSDQAEAAPRVETTTPTDEAMEDVQASWYELEAADIRRWAQTLYENGHIDEEDMADYSVLQGLWIDMAEEAGKMWSVGKKPVSIWDAPRVLAGAAWLGKSEADRLREAAGTATGFTGTRTSVSRTVNLTDPATARALVNNVLARALGREATAAELAEFSGALSSYESSNPSVTNQSYRYEDGQVVEQTASTSGGTTAAGSERLLTERARENPDYGAYQAAGPYFNALAAAIASPV